jgi:cell volume regulation protein A
MNLTTENILLVGSVLLFISLIAGKTSYRVGIPVLVFFVAIGMLAGSEGIGKINFADPKAAQFIGIVALNFILFSGGLETGWQSVRPILWQGLTLSTVGVLLTASIVGVFTWAVTDFTIYEGMLLGSIVSSTDSAAVFSILRSKSIALKGNLRSILELESGSNDPMAYILTLAFTGLVMNQDAGLLDTVPFIFRQIILGGLIGYFFGKLAVFAINKISLDYEGLYIVLAIAIMFFTFSATDFVGGNGFLAIYLCAILLGNNELIHKKKILKSFDSFAWLMQIALFLTLGLLVFPSEIVPVIGIGIIISLFLIMIARPLSVFLSLSLFDMQNRSRWFISWVGLRGAVPIVFATYPLIAGAGKADMIFNIVFFISLTSILIQGTTLPIVAKWLHLTLPEKLKQRTQSDMEFSESIKSALTEIIIPPTSGCVGKQIVQLGMPKTTLISFIRRDNKYISPNGATEIAAGDRLFILSENKDALMKVLECLDVKTFPHIL